MQRCTILVACLLVFVIISFGATKTWLSRVRRDGGEIPGGKIYLEI